MASDNKIHPENGWNEWSKFVLKELERLNESYDRLVVQVQDVKLEVAKLKARSAVWGLIAGAVPGIIAAIILILKNT